MILILVFSCRDARTFDERFAKTHRVLLQNKPPGSSISDLNMDPCQAEQFHSIFENRVDPDQQGKQAGRYTQY